MNLDEITRTRLLSYLNRFSEATVLVVGDLMLDEYIFGHASRISPEAPVPVVQAEKRTSGAGGAANVAANVRGLGVAAIVAGVVGDDQAGKQLVALLEKTGARIDGIVSDPTRMTTIKTRVLAHHQQVVRVDSEARDPLSNETATDVQKRIANLEQADCIIFSDYAKGMANSPLISWLRESTEKCGALLTAGPKPASVNHFSGFDFISLNVSEALDAAGLNPLAATQLQEVGTSLVKQLGTQGLVITRSEDGASLFTNNGWITDVPALRVPVFDVAGAGDTYLATLSIALWAGASFEDAATLAGIAAAAVVSKVGVAVVTIQDITSLLNRTAG